MMENLMVVLLLATTVSAVHYPYYVEVVRDPKEYDLLYSSTTGAHKESWYFDGEANFSSIIIPVRSFDACGSGSSTGESYEEEVEIVVQELPPKNYYEEQQMNIVAYGYFNGTVEYGQELEIPLINEELSAAPIVKSYEKRYKYIVTINFKKNGMYPWYTTRSFSRYSIVNSKTDVAGIAIGLVYTFD